VQIHGCIEDTPAWAIGFGREFWRRAVPATVSEIQARAVAAPFASGLNAGEVIERVSHALKATADGRSAGLRAKTYAVSLDGNGLRFSPSLPVASDAASSQPIETQIAGTFRTLSVARGGQTFYSAEGPPLEWSVVGNTAQALLSSAYDVVEHCETRRAGVEVAWVLNRPLPGAGPLVVRSVLDGLTYAGRTEHGFHFADSAGTARVCIGTVAVVDRTGRRWEVSATPDGNGLRLEVPQSALAQAAYPLAIDPLVSSEFGVDSPAIVSSPNDQFTPRVAFNGSSYLVVWNDDRNGGADIYGARVTLAAVIADPYGIAISAAPGPQLSPAVASDGNNFFVAWEDHRNAGSTGADIYGARVTANGAVLDTNGIPICTADSDQVTPAVTFSGTNYFVVWVDSRTLGPNGSDIFAARVATNAVVLDPGGIAISTAASFETSPAVAAGSGGYLVVWQDSRNSSTNGMDIFGSLVGANGSVLNPSGIPISTASNDQVTPAVAFNLTNYLVVWADSRTLGANGSDIFAARVTTNGSVLDANGIALSTTSSFEVSPAVAANSNGYLAVWQDSRNSPITGQDIYGTRVSAAGSVLNSSGLAISTASGDQLAPAVVASGTNYLVVWQDGRGATENIYGARVTGAGVTTDGAGFVVSTGPNTESSPAVAFNGNSFLVVWSDNRNSAATGLDIYGARVATNGMTLDPNGITISAAADTQFAPAVAANGTNFLAVWADYRSGTDFNIYGARISAAGAVLDASGIAISTASDDQTVPAVAANGSGYLVAWEDNRNLAPSLPDIYGARVTTNGVVSDSSGLAISTAPNVQTSPKIASDGTNYFVVWADFRNTGLPPAADVYGARVTSAGVVADTNGVAICTATNDQSAPAIDFNGTNYLVVWQDSRNGSYDIYAARVTPGAVVLDTNGFALCTAPDDQTAPSVAANGGTFLVVWQDSRNSVTNGSDVFGGRVSGDGSVLDGQGFVINATAASEEFPALAAGGPNQILAVSEDARNGADRVLGNLIFTGSNQPPVIRSLLVSNGTATLTWAAVVGETYRVEFKSDLASSTPWINLGLNIVFTNSVATVSDTALAGASKRFYRVVVLGNLISTAPPVIRTFTVSHGTATLTWASVSGITYRVEFKSDLASSTPWTNLGPNIVATNSVASVADTSLASVPRRFYRVVALP
jgi:hypothetical protein